MDQAPTANGFVVVDRTVALNLATQPTIAFDGMITRGLQDSVTPSSGIKLLHDDGYSYPDANQSSVCPVQMSSIGSVHMQANSITSPSNIFSLSGYNTLAGGWFGVCTKSGNVALVVAQACPAANVRGSLLSAAQGWPRV